MKLAVLGAGTMGRGIGHVAAVAGFDVSLRDVDDDVLADAVEAVESTLDGGVDRGKLTAGERDAALERVETTTDLDAAVADADLVVEAVPEDRDLKRSVLEEAEAAAAADTVLASNTSSLAVTDLASVLDDPERFVGLHFFNPVYAMALVEVVVAEQTSDETLDFAREFVESLDKTVVEVRDSPGFASSRLGVALGVEAMRMVQEGVASAEDVDAAMELGYNHPMGPLKLTDVVGLDVRLDVLEHLREELGERFRPPRILKRKVQAGKLGKKSGEGFYVWEDGEVVGVAE